MAFYVDYIPQMLFSTLTREMAFQEPGKNVIRDGFTDVLEQIILLRQILQIN